MKKFHNFKIKKDPTYCLCLLCSNIKTTNQLNNFISELNNLSIKYKYSILYLVKYNSFSKSNLLKIFDNIIIKDNLNLDFYNAKHFLVDFNFKNPFNSEVKIFQPSEQSFYFDFSTKDISNFL